MSILNYVVKKKGSKTVVILPLRAFLGLSQRFFTKVVCNYNISVLNAVTGFLGRQILQSLKRILFLSEKYCILVLSDGLISEEKAFHEFSSPG